MGIVNYLSRDPKGEPWPESVLDEKFVVTSIESFHKALDCLHSRLSDHDRPDRNENVLEYSEIDQNVSNQNTSSNSCNGNQNGLKRTKHDRNDSKTSSRLFQQEKYENSKISLSQSCQQIQSVESLKINGNLSDHEKKEMKPGEAAKNGKGKKIVRIQDRNSIDTLREEVTETTFQRTRTIQRTPTKSDSENLDSDEIPQVEWQAMNRQILSNTRNSGQSTSTVATAQLALVSFWELIGAERNDNPRSMMELEANSLMQSPKSLLQNTSGDEAGIGQVIEVDLTADSIEDREYSPEVSVVTPQQTKRVGHRSRKNEHQLTERKLFDKSLLAELVSEDTWMDRLRRGVERNDRQGFELMGPYTNPLWHQMSVVDDCHLVDNRLAVPYKLRQAVLRRLHQGNPGQEAMLEVSNYLWWPHMHKDIVNMAEECRSCTRYGKNAKYIIPKNPAKPLPLLTQPGQELQLDYAGPLEDHKGKKIYLLVAIDRYCKFPSVKVTKSTGGKSTIKFLRTYIDTHGKPESIKTDQFSGFKGKAMKKLCIENNITQKFCPVGDHRGCGRTNNTDY